MRSAAMCALALTSCAVVLPAQRAIPKQTVTTVTGRVFCEDTNTPARMATVTLQPADALDAARNSKPGEDHTAFQAESVQTLLDGSFVIPNVQPGTYYVIATAPGYVSPLNVLMMADNAQPQVQDEAARKKMDALAPRITVQANLPASVNVSLERGGVVSGTVLYDDGSPAAGLHVELLVRREGKWVAAPRMGFQSAINSGNTDDRGNYRISGLPAQEYAAQVNLNLQKWFYSVNKNGGTSGSSSSAYSFAVYSGNHMRMKDAEGFSMSTGEERGGVDIEIPVSKLHTVRGNVTAAHDGHLVNGGHVELLYPDDKSLVSAAQVTSDAEFMFSFVPEGDYLLRVNNAADTEYTEIQNSPGSWPQTRTETKVLHKYGQAEVPIHIGSDLTGVVIAAPEVKGAAVGTSY